MFRRLAPFAALVLLVAACTYESSGTTTTSVALVEDEPVATGPAGIVAEDQRSEGSSVLIDSLSLPSAGWVVARADNDGSPGEVFLAALPTVEARFEDQPELQQVLLWADKIRRMQVWANADKPEEAAQALSYGAQGIGLCRTEHMFREGERLEIARGAILVASIATRAKAKIVAAPEESLNHQRPCDRMALEIGQTHVLPLDRRVRGGAEPDPAQHPLPRNPLDRA